jgi:hypothetical protein
MLFVLNAYNKARGRGEKHAVAVRDAVATVKKSWPEMKVSETVVKRILAENQPAGAAITARVTENPRVVLSPEECKLRGFPAGTTFKQALTFGYGPRPKYPRANAVASQKGGVPKKGMTTGD